jgi:hypothetical protein
MLNNLAHRPGTFAALSALIWVTASRMSDDT